MRSRVLVVAFGELANELFEDVAHIDGRDGIGAKIGFFCTKFRDNAVENVVVGELSNFVGASVSLKRLMTHIGRMMFPYS